MGVGGFTFSSCWNVWFELLVRIVTDCYWCFMPGLATVWFNKHALMIGLIGLSR